MTAIDRILKLLQEQKITKYELHKLSGIKRSTIYSIFDPKTSIDNVKSEHIKAIAKALNVSVDYLMEGEEFTYKPMDNTNTVSIVLEDVGTLTYHFSPEKLKAIIAILNNMTEDK